MVELYINPYMVNIFISYFVLSMNTIKVHTVLSGTQTSLFTHQKEQPNTKVGSHNAEHQGKGLHEMDVDLRVQYCFALWNSQVRELKVSIIAFV